MRSVEDHQRIVLGDAVPLPATRVPLLEADGLVLADSRSGTRVAGSGTASPRTIR